MSRRTCPRCKGDGEVQVAIDSFISPAKIKAGWCNPSQAYPIACPDCSGTGLASLTSKQNPMSVKDRKEKIECVLTQAQKADVTPEEAQRAWHRLCRELGHLTEPEARMPRFNGLLRAVLVAATNEQS